MGTVTLNQLKNLSFYVHQNFLILIDLIMHRLPPETNDNVGHVRSPTA